MTVQVPNPLFTDWLTKHYSVVLAEALKDVGRPNTELIFVPEVEAAPAIPSPSPLPELVEEVSSALAPTVGLNPRYTFDTLHRRAVEPVRARRLPRRRRSPVALLQSALHLRRRRTRQDALDARHRALRAPAPSTA